MTQRKPSDLSFTSWMDRQINEAAQRGAFDDLPGAGKPLPKSPPDAAAAWLRDYAHREGVSPDDLLPVPLRLRKEIERLTATVAELPTEKQVRAEAAELNRQIIQWRRIPEGRRCTCGCWTPMRWRAAGVRRTQRSRCRHRTSHHPSAAAGPDVEGAEHRTQKGDPAGSVASLAAIRRGSGQRTS